MRSRVPRESVPCRSSERKRAYARSAAGEPARTPRKFGSWPAPARAPLTTGSDASGAVRSSWIWNRDIWVFMANRRWGEGAGGALGAASLPFISVGRAACLRNCMGALAPATRAAAGGLGGQDGDQDQQQPEQERPGDDPGRVAREPLLDRARRPPAPGRRRERRDLRQLAGAAVDADGAAAVGDDLGLRGVDHLDDVIARRDGGRGLGLELGGRLGLARLEQVAGAP